MNLRVWQNPWRLMLALNAAVLLGVFLHKITLPPYVPYIHLLVDYHFGFTKRALIGAAVGLLAAKVPVWLVFALGVVTWLITFGLFVRLAHPIAYDAIDGEPVDLAFLLLLPASSQLDQLNALAAVARKLRGAETLARVRRAASQTEFYKAIADQP